MYIVRSKKTKKILHVNPAPLSQQLSGQAIYYKFNPKTMEIGKTDSRRLPEHFNINKDGEIVELTIQEKIKAGIIKLPPEKKIINSQIVEKSLSEKVAEGIISLKPEQKIIGKETNQRIVEKSLSDKIKEGLIRIEPTQKLVGEGIHQRIVEKTLTEKVVEGLQELKPQYKLGDERIVKKTSRELYDDKLITLDEYKQRRLEYFSKLSFEKRKEIIPDYKLMNVGLGIYDETTVTEYRATIQAFREEFYRLKKLVEKAKNTDAVDAITDNYPQTIIGKRNSSSKNPRNK